MPGPGDHHAEQRAPEVPQPSFEWWQQASSVAPEVPQPSFVPDEARARENIEATKNYLAGKTTLGALQADNHPHFKYFEFRYLLWIRRILTTHWATVQGGFDGQARLLWLEIFRTLELDRKAQADIFLLAHQGVCGRSEANEIIWDLLTDSALSKQYRDLSNQCSYKVGQARRYLDRPPATDLSWHQPDPWRWSRYEGPRNMNFSPTVVPINYKLVTGPGGTPLVPPALWQSVPLPAGPPPLKARAPPSPAGPPLPARPQTI